MAYPSRGASRSLHLMSEERQRLKELERENRELRRANEILRKASAYFACTFRDAARSAFGFPIPLQRSAVVNLTSSPLQAMCALLAAMLLSIPAVAAAQTGPVESAEKLDVKIQADGALLDATLYRPAGAKGSLSAVVLSHGSTAIPRAKDYWTATALKTGVAVLAFDRRGTGASTGSAPPYTVKNTPALFGLLASDLAHAVRWLEQQPGIDKQRIGLMGGSQAGWIMPLAASQEPIVSFLIVGEGVPLSAGLEDAHGSYIDAVNRGTERGATLRQIAAADILGLDFDNEPGYDPAPVLESLDIPVLWIFGLYDGLIPARQSIDAIGKLHKAGKTNHHLHVYPFGNHDFVNVFTGRSEDVSALSRSWLREIGVMR